MKNKKVFILITIFVAILAVASIALYKDGRPSSSSANIENASKQVEGTGIETNPELSSEERQTLLEVLLENEDIQKDSEKEDSKIVATEEETRLVSETKKLKAEQEAEEIQVITEDKQEQEGIKKIHQESKELVYLGLNVPHVSKTGLTVTVANIEKKEEIGSIKYIISYKQENNTVDKKLMEGTFKMFLMDNTSLSQNGFFDYLFPGESITRTYEFQILKTQKPFCIEFNDDYDAGLEGSFFRNQPTTDTLKWKIE